MSKGDVRATGIIAGELATRPHLEKAKAARAALGQKADSVFVQSIFGSFEPGSVLLYMMAPARMSVASAILLCTQTDPESLAPSLRVKILPTQGAPMLEMQVPLKWGANDFGASLAFPGGRLLDKMGEIMVYSNVRMDCRGALMLKVGTWQNQSE